MDTHANVSIKLKEQGNLSPPELSLNWKLIQDKAVWQQTIDLSSIQYALQLIGFNAHGPKCYWEILTWSK